MTPEEIAALKFVAETAVSSDVSVPKEKLLKLIGEVERLNDALDFLNRVSMSNEDGFGRRIR